MNVYFVHKYTNNRISLNEIKQNYNKDILYHDYKNGEDYRYYIKEIPINNDFTVECVGDDFTSDDLYDMICTYTNRNSNNLLLQKLKNKFEAKRRDEILRGY
jgi:hypothetical protein